MLVFQIDKDLERPGVLDWVKDGLSRVWGFTSPFGSRQIRIWNLVPPTALYGLLHYVIASVTQMNVTQILQKSNRSALVSCGFSRLSMGMMCRIVKKPFFAYRTVRKVKH